MPDEFDIEIWIAEERVKRVKAVEKQMELARKNYEYWLKLKRMDFKVPSANVFSVQYGYSIDIEVNQLPELRDLFGQLEVVSKTIADAKEDTVWISVKPKNPDWPYSVQFRYVKKLMPGDKCRIETVYPPATQELLCKTGNGNNAI